MTTYTVTATATDATTDTITVSSATNMFSGLPIVFSGSVFGGITAGATYYIGTVVPGFPTSTITVTSLPGGAVFALSTAAGTMTGTFSSGGQQIIDIGSVPNDGTGDPLRTAFNDTNVNFDQIFAAGPVGSNVQIANNSIITTNTNGNLVLAPNGTGTVQSNVSILPNQANIRNLGSASQRWSTIYAQYLDVSANLNIAGNIVYNGDLTVDGNLTVQGNIIQVGNIVTETLTIQLANAASTANAANGSGITVGANDDIATLLYNATSNAWTTNIGVSSVGNITAPYFIGDGSQLTNLPLATNSAPGVVALGNGFALNSSNQVTTSSLYNTNLTAPTQHYALRVDTNGVVILPDQSIINGSTLRAVAGSYAGLTTDDGENSWMWVDSSGAYIATQYNESGNSHQWTFDNTGNLTLPGNGEISINYANGQPYGGTGSGGAAGNAGDIQINVAGGLGADSTLRYVDNGGEMTLYADYLNAPGIFTSDIYAGDGTPSNITLTTSYGNATWTFNDLGGTVFPTLTVQRGDNPSGTITGQTLLFGDSNQEAIISTPDGVPGNEYSQRLVINPGAGNNYGEGGDIYLWAGRGGDGSGSGGDIKIRGGQGGANTVGGSGGDGGYIRIEAGDAASTGGYAGYIDITGGTSNAVGGYVTITGGSGQTQGGDANINGGYTNSGPGGRVNINGGGSGNGLGSYGNVNIVSGINTWTFNNSGNLTLPQGGIVHETNIPFGGLSGKTIALTPYGGTDADQQLLVYPTAGADFNHLHLTTGNLWNTEMFLGNDNLYVKLANTGNIVINTNDSVGNIAQWTFGIDGHFNVPQGGYIGAAGVKGEGTMLTGGKGNIASLTSFYSNVDALNYSSCVTANPDGTLNITTYGDGTGQLGQWSYYNTTLYVPGNGSITTNNAVSGLGGNSVTVQAGTADQNNFNANAGGNLNLVGGLGGFNDDGSGGPGGDVNITAGSPGEAGGNAGNVTVNAGTNTWTFDYTGNVTIPGNLNYEGIASPAPSINGFDSVNVITVNASGNISAVGNITGSNLVTAGSGGNIIMTGGDITGALRVVTTPTALANLTAVAGGRAFVNNANLVAAGNFGNQVGSGGSNVVPVWSDGSNWYIG